MGRPHNADVPQHPAINPEIVVVTKNGSDQYSVGVTCEGCKVVRFRPLTQIRTAVTRGNFTGRCSACKAPKAKGHLGTGRYRLPDGFIALREPGITDGAELALHRKIRGWPERAGTPWVAEHVWIMAKLLGRPLRPYERVAHLNGKRDDNRPENLQLVIRYPSGRESPVLAELERARQLIELYARDESSLLWAQAQESRPKSADLSGPSTSASTSANVSPVE